MRILRNGIWFYVLACAGCVSVQIPQYLQDKHPYKKEFYANYEETLAAAKKILKNSGWVISSTSDPSVFEETPQNKHPEGRNVLIFTQEKQTSMLLFSRYTHLNIYVRALKNSTEVEIRYESVTPFPVKQFRSYRNDSFVNKLFNQIADLVEIKK